MVKLPPHAISKSLVSGSVKTRRGILTATNWAVARAIKRWKDEVKAWVEQYVPKDPRPTGHELIASFGIRHVLDRAKIVKQVVSMQAEIEFTASYASYVESMRTRGAKPTDPNRKAPFIAPLKKFIYLSFRRLLIEEAHDAGLKFSPTTMKITKE